MDVIVPFSMSCAVGALGDDLWMSVLPLWLLSLMWFVFGSQAMLGIAFTYSGVESVSGV